jgi:two-component system sensor histidine kinase PilS (NtrC family)
MATAAKNLLNSTEGTWLTWLVKARIIIIAFLLGIEFAVAAFTRTNLPQQLFVTVIVLWFAISVFFIVLRHMWNEVRMQARVQILTDLAFASAILYLTGGIDTSFNFLYPLIIIVAAILLPRYWAYLTAALSFILFGAILELSYFGVIHSYSVTRPDLKNLQAVILINFAAYLAIAYLASVLSAKLRQVGVQLQEQSGVLRNLRALHEDIVNSVSGGLATTDLEGRITFINPAAEKLLERAKEELLGTPIEQILPDRVPEIGPSGVRFEAHNTTPLGKRKTIGLSVSPLAVPSRGVIGYVYSFNDLTEIRRLEREVRLRDRMAAVGRLAAGIAHEIRNPLSSIAGSARMLRDSAALDEDERKLMDVVRSESERLNAIVTDFLSYSREKELKFEQGDLVALLDDTLTLLQNRPELNEGEHRIEIVHDIQVAQAIAMVDCDRMRQVFWNICDNAVRAMEKGGTLTVSLTAKGEDWVIAFADTGSGIGALNLEKVFEPFQPGFQGGTGLGLAIVYQIVQAHGGKISVRSTPGQGTVFTLEIKGKGAAKEAQAAAAGPSRSENSSARRQDR